jgi:hypothetical protein
MGRVKTRFTHSHQQLKLNKYENRTWYPERTARLHLNVSVHPIEHNPRPDGCVHHNANEYYIHMLHDD